jgi:Cdc6-like AAA superfamily ATPase
MKNSLHKQVLEYMLQYRDIHPNYRFWLRQQDRKQRLTNGIWFQGTEGYAFVGLYNRGGGTNMTRSFGLVFWDTGKDSKGLNIEIVWNEEKDPKVIEFYKKTIELLGGFTRSTDTKYHKFISNDNFKEKAFEWLENEKPRIDQLAMDMGLQDLMFIKEEKFQKQLQKINLIKTNTMLSANQAKSLRKLFHGFITTDEYQNRMLQVQFIPFARKVLEVFTKKEEIFNIDLTGLIQLFKAGAGNHIANKYIPILFEEEELRDRLLQEFESSPQKGYTGAGKNGISKLNEEQLEQVKIFLKEAFDIKTVDSAVNLTAEFDALNIPEVKKGVYSPWLFYINPSLFPIINTRHVQFLEWLNVETIYPEAIKLFAELRQVLKVDDLGLLDIWVYEMEFGEGTNTDDQTKGALNTIFYGPPGTGKTYTTIERAIQIANPAFDLDQSRQIVKDEYKRLCDEGQIEFITFHQSLSYEDFIEGIKPKLVIEDKDNPDLENDLQFEIKDGLFKRICRKAAYKPDVQIKEFQLTEEEFNMTSFFKLSLGDTSKPDDDVIYEYCIKNDCIAIGWGDWVDFSGLSSSEAAIKAKENGIDGFGLTALNYFIHYLEVGNYVLISNGNSYCRAIAKVIGDYYFDEDTGISYTQFKKVEWVVKDVNIPVTEIYQKFFSQQSIYRLNKQNLKLDFFVKTAETKERQTNEEYKNYVLIIDEINRGDVSQIFGELITLLEEDKREGEPETLQVTLPYSKTKFSVPKNLYIIGTMNTADRSVEALDTALRRRFCFEEMLPNPDHERIGIVEGVALGAVLKKINTRLEKLLSRDHTIGHSFFIDVNDENNLYNAFYNKIIPLLQEYFFGDYGKIGLVLGKAFVKIIPNERREDEFFANFDYEDKDLLLDKKVYRIHSFDDDVDYVNFLEAVKAI